jgi:hypothetical protein
MKKSILLVSLILLAFTIWTMSALGKAKKEENVHKSGYIQKSEPVLGPESFPQVVLPKAKPKRPTFEDFQREILDKKGWTEEKIEEMKGGAVPMGFEPKGKEPYFCRVRNQEGDAFYKPAGTEYLYCWEQVGIATYLDLDHNFFEDCPYPLYPFKATDVSMIIYVTDTCTIIAESRIYSADYSGGGPYPDQELCSSDTANPYVYSHAGGFEYVTVPLDTLSSCCLYEPFFGVFVFDNTDDFVDTNYCTPMYLPDVYVLSWIFDISGRLYQSYWNPYGIDAGWYDVVEWGIESGAIRVEVYGYTADQNTCSPPVETWYFKDPYPPGAPCGVPDFDQYQMPGPAYCGPTAGANSIWWFASRGDFPASWGGLDSSYVFALISEIADSAGTNPALGTECDSLQEAILKVIKAHEGWWFEETTVYAPDFWYLQKELRDCENVILLLGFWQTTDGGTTWQRFGGHFVTLAGVDIFNLAFAFSDPALDAAEFGLGTGLVCGTHDTLQDPLDHNRGVASYDYYTVAWPSTSPGGFLWLPDYNATEWTNFQDQNFRTEHLPYAGNYDNGYPVVVEIEQAIVVSPGLREMSGEVTSSKAYEIENNHGGVEAFDANLGAGWTYGLYYGSFIAGTSQGDLNCDYGDFYPVHTFDPSAPPTLDTFTVEGKAGDYTIYQLTVNYTHKSFPELQITKYAFGFWVPTGGVDACEYVVEDVLVLHNTGVTDITGLQTGMIFDYDVGASNLCEVDYDQTHQSMWMWEYGVSDTVFGLTKKPAVSGDVSVTGWGLSNPARIYDGQYVDSLKYWMESLGWGVDDPGTFDDKSLLMADNSFDLTAGEMHIEKWLKWGYGKAIATGGDANWRHFLYDVLYQEGYFRGDVNKDRNLSLADIVYLISYLMKSGAEPYEFPDQGDVNNDDSVSVSDIVYLISFLFKQGSAPIDKNRFLMSSPYVDSTHQALGIREPGLFGEPDWWYLGQ